MSGGLGREWEGSGAHANTPGHDNVSTDARQRTTIIFVRAEHVVAPKKSLRCSPSSHASSHGARSSATRARTQRHLSQSSVVDISRSAVASCRSGVALFDGWHSDHRPSSGRRRRQAVVAGLRPRVCASPRGGAGRIETRRDRSPSPPHRRPRSEPSARSPPTQSWWRRRSARRCGPCSGRRRRRRRPASATSCSLQTPRRREPSPPSCPSPCCAALWPRCATTRAALSPRGRSTRRSWPGCTKREPPSRKVA